MTCFPIEKLKLLISLDFIATFITTNPSSSIKPTLEKELIKDYRGCCIIYFACDRRKLEGKPYKGL